MHQYLYEYDIEEIEAVLLDIMFLCKIPATPNGVRAVKEKFKNEYFSLNLLIAFIVSKELSEVALQQNVLAFIRETVTQEELHMVLVEFMPKNNITQRSHTRMPSMTKFQGFCYNLARAIQNLEETLPDDEEWELINRIPLDILYRREFKEEHLATWLSLQDEQVATQAILELARQNKQV